MIDASDSPVTELLAQQQHRFARLDPALPESAPGPGSVISAALGESADVPAVTGSIRIVRGLPDLQSFRQAAVTLELDPLVGDHVPDGLRALLRRLPNRLPAPDENPPTATPIADTAVRIAWPSADAAASRCFLDAGLMPLTVYAIRAAPPHAAPPHAAPRDTAPGPERPRQLEIWPLSPGATPGRTGNEQVGSGELDAAVELALSELEHSAATGASVLRPGAAEAVRATLRQGADRDLVLLAGPGNGKPTGLVHAHPPTARPRLLPPGSWGFTSMLAVLPGARGSGVGTALLDRVHERFAAAPDYRGSAVCFNPPNPLSATFWPRRGYRPLWTLWEIRPAHALRV